MLTLTSYRLFVVAAFAVCIFARMRLLVCEHPAVTFGSSAYGSLLRETFSLAKRLKATEDLNLWRKKMLEELGISFGTALIILIALYFIIKWAVKNGIKEAYTDITGKETAEEIETDKLCEELGLNEEDK